MNIVHRQQHPRVRKAFAGFAAALLLGHMPAAMAQDASGLIAPPTTPEEADALSRTLYPEENKTIAEPEAAEVRRYWKFTPRVTISSEYDSNIFISPQNPQSDFIFTITPGFNFGLGDFEDKRGSFLQLDYSASALFFERHHSEDAIEQQAALNAQYRFSRLTVGLKFSFQDLAGPDVDVGDRTKRRLYRTTITTRYETSEKTFVETDLSNNFSDYETQSSSLEWSVRSSLNYRWSPKLTVGIGGQVGQLDVRHSGVQTFGRPLAGIKYDASEKLHFECDGGLEIRQFPDGSQRVDPVFDLAATWEPFAATGIRLSACRRVENSATFVGQDYKLTGVSLEIHRDIMERFRAGFATGYQEADYEPDAANAGTGATRSDRYFYMRPSLRYNIREGCHVEVFYLLRRNNSNIARYGFNDTQAGIQITFSY